MTQIEIYKRKIEREITARKEAERILEDKSLALFNANQKLLNLASELERKIELRTQDLKVAKQKAEEAQKTERAFMSNMSHEIRTPLNSIIGMAHLLQDTKLNGEQKKLIENVISSSEILLKLISDILDFSKIDAGKFEVNNSRFEVKRLIENISNLFVEKAKLKNTVVKWNIDNRINKTLIGDELILSQILINLIGNAEKFTKNGTITVNAELVKKSDKYQHVLFEVKDNGIGISKKRINQIFTAFKQEHSSISKDFGGTGLGLNISQKLANLLGSKIKVKSEKGCGSKFYFKLKLKTAGKEKKKNSIKSLKKINWKNLNILVVEDNKNNQIYITKLFGNWKVKHTIASNGYEAIEQVGSKNFDLVLMDLQMPGISGFETCQLIKSDAKNRALPIIALSASSTVAVKNKALEHGMIGFISKPFTPVQLKQKVAELLAGQNNESTHKKTNSKKNPGIKKILKKRFDNNIEFALSIYNSFLEESKDYLKRMQYALENKNTFELKKIAHEIAPSFAMVGLPKLAKQLKSISEKSEDANFKMAIAKFEEAFKPQKAMVTQQLNALKKMNKAK